jgi:hypothetical protein
VTRHLRVQPCRKIVPLGEVRMLWLMTSGPTVKISATIHFSTEVVLRELEMVPDGVPVRPCRRSSRRDHRVPVASGQSPANRALGDVAACRRCNIIKGTVAVAPSGRVGGRTMTMRAMSRTQRPTQADSHVGINHRRDNLLRCVGGVFRHQLGDCRPPAACRQGSAPGQHMRAGRAQRPSGSCGPISPPACIHRRANIQSPKLGTLICRRQAGSSVRSGMTPIVLAESTSHRAG